MNIDKFGRPKFHMKIDGKNKRMSISRIVWIENFGEIPKGMIIHHIDGNPANNNLSNLQMISRLEHDQLHNFKKLDEKEIFKNYHKDKMNFQKIGEKYNCSSTTIRRLFKRKGWKARTQSELNKIYWESE